MTIATPAIQSERAAEMRAELAEADARTEAARLEFVTAQQDDPEAARDKRRAWDHARAARNEIEGLLLMQGARDAASEPRP